MQFFQFFLYSLLYITHRKINVGAAQFFANALDTKTTGLDLILAYSKNIDSHIFKISYAGNFNSMVLGSVKTSPKLKGKEDIYFGKREKYFLLASAPESKMSLGIEHSFEIYIPLFGLFILVKLL